MPDVQSLKQFPQVKQPIVNVSFLFFSFDFCWFFVLFCLVFSGRDHPRKLYSTPLA